MTPLAAVPPQPRGRNSIDDQLPRVSQSLRWLDAHGIKPLSISASTLSAIPTISVEPSPRLYGLFDGRTERRGYRQEGARRYEVYEAVDDVARVLVIWQEVVCGM
jgi:hypothetical protein